jgi:hypothetical protein
MIAPESSSSVGPAARQCTKRANVLTERVRHYFERHPQVSGEDFLLEAIRNEIHLREQAEIESSHEATLTGSGRSKKWSRRCPAFSTEEVGMRASLAQRVAELHYERHGLWPQVRRLFFGRCQTSRATVRFS